MSFATSRDGTRTWYEVRGTTGPWVVLIQGLGLSHRYWGDVPDRLAQAHRVLVVDNRGAGRSDKPATPYTTARMGEDVGAAIDAAGAERPVVVGISLGGMIAQQVGIQRSKDLSGLLLLATTPGLPHGVLPGPRAVAMLSRLPFARTVPARAALYESMFFASCPKDRAQAHVEYLLAHWEPLLVEERMAARDFFLLLAAASTHSAGAQLSRVKCRVHVVHGEDDRIIPARNTLAIARLVRHASFELLPGVGHALPVQDGDVVARGIRRLLDAPAADAAA